MLSPLPLRDQPDLPAMEADTFLAWAEGREGRFELVDGKIVAMSGAQRRHDRVVTNAIITLGGKLRDHPCQPGTADLAVKINTHKVRRPDVLVDCGPTPEDALYAHHPILVIEVLSPSTRQTDLIRKLDEYHGLDGLLYILMLEPAAPIGVLHHRAEPGGRWESATLEGLEAAAELPFLGCSLALAELYRGLPTDPEADQAATARW